MGNNHQGFSYNMDSAEADLRNLLNDPDLAALGAAEVVPGSSSRRSSSRSSRRAPQPVPAEVIQLRGQADALSQAAKADST